MQRGDPGLIDAFMLVFIKFYRVHAKGGPWGMMCQFSFIKSMQRLGGHIHGGFEVDSPRISLHIERIVLKY